MKIKIGNKTILCTRKKDHKDFLLHKFDNFLNKLEALIFLNKKPSLCLKLYFKL